MGGFQLPAKSNKADSSERPRHSSLSEILAAEIGSGMYPVGGKFPTEQDLQKRFGVGRHTVREALKTLSDQGLLGRRRKLGTHVLARRPFAHYAHTIRDVRGLFDFAGDTYLDIRMEGSAVPSEALAGQALAGERWQRVAGVRHTAKSGEPLCWSEIFVPAKYPLDRAAIRQGRRAIYEYCMEVYGIRLDHVQQEVRATILPVRVAELLAAEPESSALLVTRRYVDEAGSIFEISVNLYPSDRYSVRTIIRPRS
jgi:DNA-binding GntR family transcriptional regulator